MERILEIESIENLNETLELDRMSQKYIYILNEAMARSAMRMGVAEGRVLEIGVGPARIATKLINYNPKFSIIGIDLSSNMLTLAKKNINEADIKQDKITLLKADAKHLPFKAESFDLIISQNMLHHLPEPVSMLKEISRVIKPTGAILIRDVVRPANKFLAGAYACMLGLNYTKKMRKMYYDSMLAAFSIPEMKEFLARCGMDNTAITRHFLTHYGIEKYSPLNQRAKYLPKRFDIPRELIMSLYKNSGF